MSKDTTVVSIYTVNPHLKSNLRQFSVVTSFDLDDVNYTLSIEGTNCGMQHVGQTCRLHKTRFSEWYCRMK